jgi:hypothetical protein
MQTRINSKKYTFCGIKSLEHLKHLKTGRVPLFRPRTDHACAQKPNPSRETVPLRAEVYIIPPNHHGEIVAPYFTHTSTIDCTLM